MTALLTRLFLLACLLASSAALGQTYPDRNVTIVVTSAAGALLTAVSVGRGSRINNLLRLGDDRFFGHFLKDGRAFT
jgi:hypothetical protein